MGALLPAPRAEGSTRFSAPRQLPARPPLDVAFKALGFHWKEAKASQEGTLHPGRPRDCGREVPSLTPGFLPSTPGARNQSGKINKLDSEQVGYANYLLITYQCAPRRREPGRGCWSGPHHSEEGAS